MTKTIPKIKVVDVTITTAKHSSMNNDCARFHRDDCFSVLSRARSRKHLDILESGYIHVQRPVLCVQEQFVTPLNLFKSHVAPVTT